jgi:hypothetical protein
LASPWRSRFARYSRADDVWLVPLSNTKEATKAQSEVRSSFNGQNGVFEYGFPSLYQRIGQCAFLLAIFSQGTVADRSRPGFHCSDITAIGIVMSTKMTALIGATACAGLVVTFAPGFAREIASVFMPSDKLLVGMSGPAAITRPNTPSCSSEPWPYGCSWHASPEKKRVAKKSHNRRHRDFMTSYLSASRNLKEE